MKFIIRFCHLAHVRIRVTMMFFFLCCGGDKTNMYLMSGIKFVGAQAVVGWTRTGADGEYDRFAHYPHATHTHTHSRTESELRIKISIYSIHRVSLLDVIKFVCRSGCFYFYCVQYTRLLLYIFAHAQIASSPFVSCIYYNISCHQALSRQRGQRLHRTIWVDRERE